MNRQEGLEEGEKLGDWRVEGQSAIEDGGKAAMPFMPDTDGTHAYISESSQLEGLCVGDLLHSCWKPWKPLSVSQNHDHTPTFSTRYFLLLLHSLNPPPFLSRFPFLFMTICFHQMQ